MKRDSNGYKLQSRILQTDCELFAIFPSLGQ
jgi:hypothetical protein